MTSVPEIMKGVYLTAHGDTDNLKYLENIPVSKPYPDEVLVKVAAAGVNNTDINTRIGWYSKKGNSTDDAGWSGKPLSFPRIQGGDVCGKIIEAGINIDQSRIGERVILEPCLREFEGQQLDHFWYLGSECDGGFAEYVKIASRHAYAIDCDLTDTELASFPVSYSTAENLLTRANVKAGETVFITGASGGVGSAAIQLAKTRNAHVIAVTSPNKRDSVLEVGADKVIDRGKNYLDALGDNSVDVVVDLVAGDQWPQLLEILKPEGRYAVSGAIAGPLVELDVRTLYLKDLTFLGCTKLSPEVFGNLVAHIENGDISPLVAQTFPLSQIVQAQKKFLKKDFTGKLVLTI